MQPSARLVVLALLTLTACLDPTPTPHPETQATPLRIPGPWDPPPATRNLAATQHVAVVDPPAISPEGRCTSTNAFACSCTHPACNPAYPGTVDLREHLLRRFPQLRNCGTYCCRQNSAQTSVPRLSVHAIGRAIDLCVPLEAGDADNGAGDPVANWLVENAELIGIQRVIWDRAFWNGERGFGLLSAASLPHTDHLHIELSIPGSQRQTAFFTSGAVNGTCTPRCDGTRVLNADCSSLECAAQGSTCQPGDPPSCTPPPPPEPAEAAYHPDAPLPTLTDIAAPARLRLVTPQRLFDTRTDAASATLRRGDGTTTGPLTANAPNTFDAWQPTPLTPDATAVWLNLAVIGADTPGFARVHPAGEPPTDTSNVNFQPATVRANGVPARLGAGQGVAFDTSTPVHAVADLSGIFAPTGDGLSTTATLRAYDSRSTLTPLAPGEVREIDLPIPPEATGVAITLTAVPDEAPGFLTAFPCGASRPDTSTVNYAASRVTANTALIPVHNGKLCVYSLSQTHIIVDLIGHLAPNGPLAYRSLRPVRLLDTRQTSARYEGRLAARQVVRLPIQSLPNAPDAAWGLLANLTTLGATEPGFITAYPCTDTIPNISSGNYRGDGDVVATATLAALSPQGDLCIFSSARVHLIVDLLGLWTHEGASQPPPDTQDELPLEGGDELEPDPADEADPDPTTDDADPITPDPDADPITPDPDADDATPDAPAPDDPQPNRAAVNEGCSTLHLTPTSHIPHLAPAWLLALLTLRRRR